jgi:hypothetical protein
MTPLHPKLNWETFEHERARRKRRKFFWWFSSALGMLGLLAWGVYSFTQPAALLDLASKAPTEIAQPADILPPATTPAETLAAVESADAPAQGLRPKVQEKRSNLPTKSVVAASMNPKEATQPNITPVKEQPASVLAQQVDNLEPATPNQQPSVLQEAPTTKASKDAALTEHLSTPMTDSVALALENNIPNRQKTAQKPGVNNAWTVFAAWSPWHLAEFETAVGGASSLAYRPLNSLQLGLGVDVFSTSKMKIRLEPQFVVQRFQMQFEGDLAAFQIAPGSVVGYVQDFKGVVPVISDTVRGLSNVRTNQNGSLQELIVPVSLSTALWNKGTLQLRLNLSAGFHYVFALRGTWFNGTELYALQRPDNRLGLLGGGGLALSYQPRWLIYQADISSMYRGATTNQQMPWRHQLQLSVAVPLRKR